MAYNHITLMGRITADVELKTTQNGTPVTTFTVAVDRNHSGKEEKQTDFIRCTAWKGTAEFITRYFGKGRLILLDGELQSRKYTDKNNNEVTSWEVVVRNVTFTGEPKQASNVPQDKHYNKDQDNTSKQAPNVVQNEFESVDEDYPF